MKTGILGGTFDPPHLGHRAMAEAAMAHLGLEEVIWIPAGRNPLKRRQASPPSVRLELTKLAAAAVPGFSASNIETAREGPSYMADTLEELSMVRPFAQWWLIVGSDTLRTLMDWKNPEKVARLARFALILRGSESAGLVRSSLPSWVHDRIDVVPMRPWPISSTQIRSDVEQGRAVEQWLEESVWRSIEANGMYQKVAKD